MSQSGRSVVLAVVCLVLGVLLGRVLPQCGKGAAGMGERQQMSEVKSTVLQHVAKATKEFAPTSDVDVVVETMDRQPNGKIMVVGFCRLVTPKPGGVNGGRFWLELVATGKDGGYEVKDIASKYGMTEDGAPWGK